MILALSCPRAALLSAVPLCLGGYNQHQCTYVHTYCMICRLPSPLYVGGEGATNTNALIYILHILPAAVPPLPRGVATNTNTIMYMLMPSAVPPLPRGGGCNQHQYTSVCTYVLLHVMICHGHCIDRVCLSFRKARSCEFSQLLRPEHVGIRKGMLDRMPVADEETVRNRRARFRNDDVSTPLHSSLYPAPTLTVYRTSTRCVGVWLISAVCVSFFFQGGGGRK